MRLPLVASGWLFGIAAVALWDASPWWSASVLALLAIAALRFAGRECAALLAVAAILALAGGWRFESWDNNPPPHLAAYTGDSVVLEGTVASDLDPGTTTVRVRIDAARIRLEGGQPSFEPTGGAVLLTLPQFVELERGSRVRVEGELEEAPVFPGFDYRAYLARQGVAGTMLFPSVEVIQPPGAWNVEHRLSRLRQSLDEALQRALPEPQASLAGGIAFGRDGNLPDDLYDDFRATNLAHIVAVSGSNVMLIAALTFAALVPFLGRRYATLPAILGVACYCIIVGYEASVVRSGIMAAIYLAGAAFGRQRSALPALGLAAIMMTALDPSIAVDLGFQLSLAATAGIIVFSPWVRLGLDALAARARATSLLPGLALEAAAISVAATIATTPILWITFGQVSLVGPLANIVVQPVFALAFWAGVVTAVAGAAWEPLGWLCGLVAWYPLAFITGFAGLMASVPGAAISVPKGDGDWAFAGYAVLALLAWPAYRLALPLAPPRPPTDTRVRAGALAAVGGALAVAAWSASLAPVGGPGELRIQVLDIGQGDATLVTTPAGRQVLVDGGPSGIKLARELGATMPHWDRTIEAVVLTHPDLDHVAGLAEASRRYEIGTVYENGAPATTAGYLAFVAGEPSRSPLHTGDAFEVDGVRFEVLWPRAGDMSAEDNDRSIVIRVVYGEFSMLLTGDIEAGPQRALRDSGTLEPVDVLKVPHHGSSTSDPDFLAWAAARGAVISVGAGNPFGHPTGETIGALAGVPVLRTDHHGRVTIHTNGVETRITTERGGE